MNQLHALGITLACELPIMPLLARTQPVMRVLVIAASASIITHPIAWHIASVLSPDEYPTGLWIIEFCVILAEAAWYQFWLRNGLGKSLWWSLLANTLSFAAGVAWVSLS